MSQLTYAFVHGLYGWGSYDKRNRRLPYWGMRSGDLTARLRREGFDCYAAPSRRREAPGTAHASSTRSWRRLLWIPENEKPPA